MPENILNCLTKAKLFHKNILQHSSVPLTELINKNALSFATNLSINL